MENPKNRNEEIFSSYLAFLDQHLEEILSGEAADMLHINQIAEKLFLSPGHLTNTVKLVSGHHPCYYYDHKIIKVTNDLLIDTQISASEIARKLTFDPSNFIKFYRSLTGITPTEFRKLKKLPAELPIETKLYQR